MPEEGGQRGAHSLRPGSGTRRVLELVEARLEAGEARLADAARRPLLVDEARLDEDVAAARRRERVAEPRRDGAELAAAALDVARVADERLAAVLAAADVGAVHACTPSTRQSPVSWRLATMACRWEVLRASDT